MQEQQVARACIAAVHHRVVHKRGSDPQQEDGTDVCAEQHDPLERRTQPTARAREPCMRHDRRGGREEDEPDGERERRTRTRVVPVGEEPAEAGRNEHDSEPSAASSSELDRAHDEQRPPRGELQRRARDRHANERELGRNRESGERVRGRAACDHERQRSEAETGQQDHDRSHARVLQDAIVTRAGFCLNPAGADARASAPGKTWLLTDAGPRPQDVPPSRG